MYKLIKDELEYTIEKEDVRVNDIYLERETITCTTHVVQCIAFTSIGTWRMEYDAVNKKFLSTTHFVYYGRI